MFFTIARILRITYMALRAIVGIVTVGSTVVRWSGLARTSRR